MLKKTLMSAAVASSLLMAGTAFAGEHPAGDTLEMNGMEIAAVYLEPVTMEPQGMMMAASKADVHLEADIHALKGNKNGFAAGEWIPYLTIAYKLKNLDTGKSQEGTFMPMIASDGPHYGSNVKMLGVGNYELTFHIDPPSKAGLLRHTDKATGVGRWFKPFDATYKFQYVGLN
ncbi:iron transporter [Sansalvadorimonas verongulae]|uniref:iron transporter n=1 Tax=Sansalvadorimonas verongulae TaxID=2172824 RepID=UPI0012BD3848|nr:iron transporter [Sansalvadorimonas verongulae]MTI15400.1 iron transporter [Sansalvadorimonas verongulae]